ncbi:carboxymuconolactone decarboxylase family protein, partial [Schlesneria sp.]|uniref:carboxymuconolactone decarboxylase family protein n=1 Tax=Schlesneria sp. TaxID=2762018 RepID=UPI002EE7AF5C
GNECRFCTSSHAAAARHLLGDRSEIVDAVIADLENAPVDAKLKALLTIAGKVRRDGRTVTPEDVHTARMAGADDKAIHDTVLIAAMFCMYNRYVDGLATLTPQDPELYREMGKRLATQGYVG